VRLAGEGTTGSVKPQKEAPGGKLVDLEGFEERIFLHAI
jgi:hypothetical protein